MTATINASTTAGVVTTADTSGILQLQTNGTAALTVDASQNVGIGTSTPYVKLQATGTIKVATGNAQGILSLGDGSGATVNCGVWRGAANAPTTDGNFLNFGGYDGLVFATGNAVIGSQTERMRIDSSGNVGIGTASPTTPLDVKVGTGNFTVGLSGAGNTQLTATGALRLDSTGGTTIFQTGGSERARIDSSGNFLVGATSFAVSPSQGFNVQNTSGASISVGHANGTGSGFLYANFAYNSGQIGSITQNGTTAVAYNTTSDYRLKQNIEPMTGALARIAALKPVTYIWKSAPDEIGEGFIAHELAEVVPQCVTGEKDAVQEEQYEVTPAVKDEKGNTITEAVMGTRTVPVYQGIDTSFLVATLTAAIQELKAIVDGQAVLIATQGAEIAALKGATA